MASYLITGTSRGLGLALARQLASLPASDVSKVFATARTHVPVLEELARNSSGRVIVVELDVTNETSIKRAVAEVEAELQGKGLDVLINNAGVCQYASRRSQINGQPRRKAWPVNVLGVQLD